VVGGSAHPGGTRALPSVFRSLLSTRTEVTQCVGGRATVCLKRTVASMLESSRTLSFRWYRLHYRPPLELESGSEVSHLD
jgi:hypothetical protein